jgi:hypothetical protein
MTGAGPPLDAVVNVAFGDALDNPVAFVDMASKL